MMSKHGGGGLIVGLDDLSGLFQLYWFCDPKILGKKDLERFPGTCGQKITGEAVGTQLALADFRWGLMTCLSEWASLGAGALLFV